MNQMDFKQVADVFAGLWPKKWDTLTDEQRNAFWMVCAKHEQAVVTAIMRDWKTQHRYAIEPNDLRKRLAERKEKLRRAEQDEDWRLKQEDTTATLEERERRDQVVASMTTEQLTKAKQAIIQQTGWQHLADADPATSPTLKTMIARQFAQ